MNIILCDKNCRHQKDGYCNCNINYSQVITDSNQNECPYFFNKNNKKNNITKTSIFENIKKIN